MSKRLSRASKLSVICFVTVALVVLALPAISRAMVMSPYKIILNADPAVENYQDMQAIIHYPCIPINLYNAVSTLSFVVTDENGNIIETIAEFDHINDVKYCYIDDNFLISFDREAIQNDPGVQNLANTGPVTVEVVVEFDVTETTRITISATAEVEILAPGKKSSGKQ